MLEFVLKQAVMSATPLLLAGFGELVAERAGVINIGIEGLMLMGAIAGYAAAVVAGTRGRRSRRRCWRGCFSRRCL